MPGESVSLPAISQIPPRLTGQAFLVASHFEIGYDRRLSKSATKRSTFTKDYHLHGHYGRSPAAVPPAPAEVMHRTKEAEISDVTETLHSFEPKKYSKLPPCATLSKTNFKMDADESIDSFKTTHSKMYPPKPFSRSLPMAFPMRSYVPQGDREKEPIAVSDYKTHFTGHDTSKFTVERAPCMHVGGQSTVRGDDRTHGNFSTSTRDQFPAKYLPYKRIKPNTTGSNIPNGDVDKLNEHVTTQEVSFPEHDSSNYKAYEREQAIGCIGGTNFKMGHTSKYDKFATTAADAYCPMGKPSFKKEIPYDNNGSSFPEGDRHPERDRERVSTTNYTTYHTGPPKGFRNEIISGAEKRVASKVILGESKPGSTLYSTTQNDAYPAVKPLHPVSRVIGPTSKVPMDYYKDTATRPTTLSDFPAWKVGKHHVTAEALEQLRKSHIDPPLGGERSFNTTHLTSYTAKTAQRYQYDSGRLQRSSLPLGTMTI
ncbi:stabilizer of axonemal microtubules 5-like [Antedon mediterranea]|uniref:stabilizer of axonemal microtubules 5-like n=1 Tax=Antedon mediterranea TaxID=105859 RepID=UPI003AF52700